MAHSGTIIYMRSVPDQPNNRALTAPLPAKNFAGEGDFVPIEFTWDGSSVPALFQGIFPRHNHPIASCRHDWRCKNAKNSKERKWADGEFQKDVGTTSWWITKKVGYYGVRVGAFFGIGVNY
jgi:hypothetical protein